MRPLSHTSISTYQQCPLLYKLKYVDGRREEARHYLSWGKSLHDALEFLYSVKVPPSPSLEELLDCYKQRWRSEGYESPEEEAKYFAEGRRILEEYYRANVDDFRLPVAVERMFNLDIEGAKLTGFFDRVDKLDDDTLAILDYKSSRPLFDKEYLANDLQLTLYQLAAESLWDIPVGRLTLYHLRSNTPCSTGPRERAQLDNARQLVLQVAAEIESGKFEPRENQFCPCDFPSACPYYSQLYKLDRSQAFFCIWPRRTGTGIKTIYRSQAFSADGAEGLAPELQAQTALSFEDVLKGIDIKQVVEEYAAVKAAEKEAKGKAAELAEIIRRFCASENLKRVYGLEHAVTLSESKRANYDAELVKKILEPLGLWPKVLDFEPKALERLVEAGDLSGETLALLDAAKTVTSSPRLTLKKLVEEELAD